MELKVWVEGIQRVICGVTEETTCQDVVIALAHATGRTGRFTLIEKWRDNERLVPPGEYPLKLLRNWGEYACDVQYSLKYSGDRRTRNSGKLSKSRTDNNNKFLRNFSPHLFQDQQNGQSQQQQHTQPPQNRANVKRNLTFSGAHQSNLLTPARSNHNQRKLPPFENSSLDSVEEQSSLSSHSSSSPYSSFQSAGSSSQSHRSYNNHQRDPNQNHRNLNNDVVDFPIATSSISSTPVISPKDTPTNSLERSPKQQEEQTGLSGSPSTISGHNNTHQSSSNQRRDHLFSPPVRHQKQPAPRVLTQSLDTSQLRGQFHHRNVDSVHVNSSHSPLSSHNSSLDCSGSDFNHSQKQDNHHHPHHPHSRINHQHRLVENGVYTNGDDPNILIHSSSNNNNGLSSQNDHAFTQQQQTQQQQNHQYQHNKVDSSSSETDENKNSKHTADLSALLESQDFSDVSRDDLVRLVNLQVERLNSYEDKLKNIDSEIHFYEQRDGEAVKQLQHIKSESTRLTSQESELESEIQEFEIVSWEDKLELEQKKQIKLQTEVDNLQSKLSKCEIEVLSYKQKADHLHVEIEGERQLQSKHQTLQEVSDLQKQIQQKVGDHQRNERTLDELGSLLKKLESGILDKKTAMSELELDLKGVNLELFNLKPAATGAVVVGGGEDGDHHHVRQGSTETAIPFARSSSSRAVSSRKIPNKAMSLKEAIESEPQGYWV